MKKGLRRGHPPTSRCHPLRSQCFPDEEGIETRLGLHAEARGTRMSQCFPDEEGIETAMNGVGMTTIVSVAVLP